MPFYRQNLGTMPQAAQSAMSSASSAMANQQKQTTTVTKKERNFWDDLEKGARAVGAVAGAANNTVTAIDKGIDLYDDIKVKNAYDNIAKTFAEGGYEAIQKNPDMQDYHHSLALGKFVKDRANTAQGRLDMMKKADEIADMQYQDFRNQAILVKEAWDKGDMEKYMNGMERLVANAPFPYRLAPDGQGNFDELFRSDKAGGEWVKTGRKLTAQQAFDQMNGIMRGEQMVLRGIDGRIQPYNEAFNRRAAANYVNTAYGNGNLSADPKNYTPLYDRNGNFAGAGIIQNPWLNEDGSLGAYGRKAQIKLFDRNGKAIGMVDGWDGAMQRGLYMGNQVRGAGRAGGGGRGGSGRGAPAQATGQGNYGVSANGSKIFAEVCTTTGEDGSKTTNYSAVAGLKALRIQTGIGEEELAGAFQHAKANGLSDEQAIGAISQQIARHLGGQQKTEQAPAPASRAEENPANARIREAVEKKATSARTPRADESAGNNDPAAVNLIWQNTATGRKPYIVTKSGAVEISEKEANEIMDRQKAEPSLLQKAWNNKREPTRRVTYADVEKELSAEEKEAFRKTGKLPARYNQVR